MPDEGGSTSSKPGNSDRKSVTMEVLFGQSLVQEGALSREQLDAAVRTQESLRTDGVSLRLGEILVRKGLLTPEQVKDFLHLAGKQILHCPSCKRNYNVTNWTPDKEVSCPGCHRPLDYPLADSTIDASATQRIPDPAGVAAGDRSDSEGAPFGRYRLLAELGRGGMGVVWKAWDTQLKRIVALKQIQAAGAARPVQVERFLREARLAAKLRHPSIIAVHDVGLHDGQPYFTTDYVAGRPLSELLKKPIPPRQAVGIVRAVAEALQYAHDEGVVHRDVKPGNILVDMRRRPFVMDFGLALEVEVGTDERAQGAERLTRSGVVLGTAEYMSPEQAAGETDRIGPGSDQFSLGIVLYELLTRRLPFQSQSFMGLLHAVCEQDPVRPRRLRPQIHHDLETICLKALEKDPAKRYRSIGEFGADLGRYLEGEPIDARPTSSVSRLIHRATKHRSTVLLAAAALLASIALAGFVRYSRTEHEKELEAAGHQRAELEASEARTFAEQKLTQAEALWREAKSILMRKDLPLETYHQKLAATLKLYDEAMVRAPNYGWIYESRGRIKTQAGDLCGAEEDLQKAVLLLGPSAGKAAHLSLARCYFERFSDRSKVLGGEIMVGDPHTWRERALSERALADGCTEWRGLQQEREVLTALLDAGAYDPKKAQEAIRLLTMAFIRLRDEDLAYALAEMIVLSWGAPSVTLLEWRHWVDETLRIRPRHARALWLRSVVAEGHPRADLEEALRIAPRLAVARKYRGTLLLATDPAAAVKDFTEAINADHRDFGALSLRAAALLGLGDLAGAEQDLNRLLAGTPEGPHVVEVLHRRMTLRLATGNALGAIEDASELVRRDENENLAYLLRAVLRWKAGDQAAALSDCERGLRTAPGFEDSDGEIFTRGATLPPLWLEAAETKPTERIALAHAAMALAMMSKNLVAAGLTYAEEAVRLSPDKPLLLLARGRVRQTLGRLDEAMVDYEAALRLDPRSGLAYGHRGVVRRLQGDRSGALSDFDEAMRLGPPSWQLAIDRFALRQDRGDQEGATSDLEAALALAPEDWESRVMVQGAVQTRRGRPTPAGGPASPGTPTGGLAHAASGWRGALADGARLIAGGKYTEAGEAYSRGLAEFDRAIARLPSDERERALADTAIRTELMNAHYDLACVKALASVGKGRPNSGPAKEPPADAAHLRDLAFDHLLRAVSFGYADFAHLAADEDLVALRADPRWADVLRNRK